MKLSIHNLENCFKSAKDLKQKYVGVKISMRGFKKPEIIINEYDNFDEKLKYYKNAYNEDLVLKSFNGIKIVGFTYGNTFDEIEIDLGIRGE